jgi:hypothetical protein
VQGSFGGTAYVPPVPYRTGDFSSSPITIYDPTTGKPFPGNIIAPDRIKPFASKFLSGWVPAPNANEPTINFRGRTFQFSPISRSGRCRYRWLPVLQEYASRK